VGSEKCWGIRDTLADFDDGGSCLGGVDGMFGCSNG
jgi:hypothetical protein